MTNGKSDTWMPFYVGDYLQATGRLTPEQHGAYLLILLDYWTNGPPPNDDVVLAQIARMTPAAWRKTRPALIGFFDIEDGRLVQKRVEKERKRASDITSERSKAGKLGAEKRWQRDNKTDGKPMAKAMAKPQQNDAPLQPPKNKNNLQPSSPVSARDCFNEVCAAADWHPANDTQRIENLSVIDGWLALGCSVELILDGIAKARRRDPSPTRSLKRFDSTIRGQRRDQLGGELPVTSADVEKITKATAKHLTSPQAAGGRG